MPRADIPHQGHPGPPQHPSSGESRSPLLLFQQPPTPLPGQLVVPCWPGRKGSATLAFRRLWAVASFCFRACISEASLDGGGEQGRVSLLPRHQSRRRPGTGLEPHGVCLGPRLPPASVYPQGDPLGGPGHGFGVRSWDAEAGSRGALGLPTRALHNPGVWVRVVQQRVLLTLQQLHLRGR